MGGGLSHALEMDWAGERPNEPSGATAQSTVAETLRARINLCFISMICMRGHVSQQSISKRAPSICAQVWDLNVLDALEPVATLGATEESSSDVEGHAEAVMALAWNRLQRNVRDPPFFFVCCNDPTYRANPAHPPAAPPRCDHAHWSSTAHRHRHSHPHTRTHTRSWT